MIIFDLDGCLANCEHRRHFVDPRKNLAYKRRLDITLDEGINDKRIPEEYIPIETTPEQCLENSYKIFQPDWKSFYEACDKDEPIEPVVSTLRRLSQHQDVQIWSGRCESVREKTLKWLVNLTGYCEDYQYWDRRLKMRPIGNSTPDYVLKELWLNDLCMKGEYVSAGEGKVRLKHPIDFVFDSDPKSIEMWRRRGFFVFNCCQYDEESSVHIENDERNKALEPWISVADALPSDEIYS